MRNSVPPNSAVPGAPTPASAGNEPGGPRTLIDPASRLPTAAHPHSVRIIHTSDVHVGAGFLTKPGGREESLHFLETIMGAAVDLDADLVLIAGDFFDNNRVKEPLVAETASIVGSTGKPVVILPGNHDPHMPGSMYDRFAHHFADHVHIFNDADGQLLTLDDVGVQIWGQAHTSYDDFSPAGAGPAWEDQLDPPLWRIAMAHGSAVGFDGRLSFGYRIEEEHLADLQAHYVALGHLDRHGQTGPPGTTAYYSGAPGLLKGFTLVDLRPHGIHVQPVLFETLAQGNAPKR